MRSCRPFSSSSSSSSASFSDSTPSPQRDQLAPLPHHHQHHHHHHRGHQLTLLQQGQETPFYRQKTTTQLQQQQRSHQQDQQQGSKQQQQQQLRHGNSGNNRPCVVCNETNASQHYMKALCNGCKAFFRRSIVDRRTYRCRYGGRCKIDAHDRKCRHCRLEKCFRIGLRADVVHPSRKSVDSAGCSLSPSPLLDRSSSRSTTPLHSSSSSSSNNNNSSSSATMDDDTPVKSKLPLPSQSTSGQSARHHHQHHPQSELFDSCDEDRVVREVLEMLESKSSPSSSTQLQQPQHLEQSSSLDGVLDSMPPPHDFTPVMWSPPRQPYQEPERLHSTTAAASNTICSLPSLADRLHAIDVDLIDTSSCGGGQSATAVYSLRDVRSVSWCRAASAVLLLPADHSTRRTMRVGVLHSALHLRLSTLLDHVLSTDLLRIRHLYGEDQLQREEHELRRLAESFASDVRTLAPSPIECTLVKAIALVDSDGRDLYSDWACRSARRQLLDELSNTSPSSARIGSLLLLLASFADVWWSLRSLLYSCGLLDEFEPTVAPVQQQQQQQQQQQHHQHQHPSIMTLMGAGQGSELEKHSSDDVDNQSSSSSVYDAMVGSHHLQLHHHHHHHHLHNDHMTVSTAI